MIISTCSPKCDFYNFSRFPQSHTWPPQVCSTTDNKCHCPNLISSHKIRVVLLDK